MAERILQDLDAAYWTLDQAAAHFGITRRSVRRYIADGLPSYLGDTMVKPAEYIATHLERRARDHATRIPTRRDGAQ